MKVLNRSGVGEGRGHIDILLCQRGVWVCVCAYVYVCVYIYIETNKKEVYIDMYSLIEGVRRSLGSGFSLQSSASKNAKILKKTNFR